jgi:hypothetical protein
LWYPYLAATGCCRQATIITERSRAGCPAADAAYESLERAIVAVYRSLVEEPPAITAAIELPVERPQDTLETHPFGL